MAQGMIFDIKEFAIYDGPGIRKTVFLKGCPLRCFWCHNPEGISFHAELMVSQAACIACGHCTDICGKTICDACGSCVAVCPLHLRKISGTMVESAGLARDLMREKEFFDAYGGGVTFSGGEPLAQPEFLLDLLRRVREIHTAIETSGYAPREVFAAAAEQASLILFDIKHLDPNIHQQITGAGNSLILENLHFLISMGQPFIVRMALIPGVNDQAGHFTALARLLEQARSLIRVEFLPYHKTAGVKYKMLSQTYAPPFDEDAKPAVWLEPFQQAGIAACVL